MIYNEIWLGFTVILEEGLKLPFPAITDINVSRGKNLVDNIIGFSKGSQFCHRFNT